MSSSYGITQGYGRVYPGAMVRDSKECDRTYVAGGNVGVCT